MDRSSIKFSSPVIEVEGLCKSVATADGQGVLHILRDIGFAVGAGESVAIVGASGSGKSTLLGLLAGLDVPVSGSVKIMGTDLFSLGEDARAALRGEEVGFVFQFYNLIPSLTAVENVALITEISRNPMIPAEALALVELADRKDHFPSQLSGGQQQRVAIARAIAKRPTVLFCDEPTGALDSTTGRAVLRVLQDVNEQLGATVLIITHAAATAAMADRVIHFSDGHIREVVVNASKRSAEEIVW